MDDDVAGIDQHPISVGQALNSNPTEAFLFEVAGHVICNRGHVPLRPAGSNDHMVCDGGFSLEIDHDQLFSFVVFEGLDDSGEAHLHSLSAGISRFFYSGGQGWMPFNVST